MKPVILPVLGANMTHGTIRAWYKQEDETVEAGEVLFEVETDKVNAEVEAEESGILRKILAPPGTRLPTLAVVALIGEAGEPLPELEASGMPDGADVHDRPHPAPALTTTPTPEPARASPAARRLARELGVSLHGARGSGPRGEITRADVERLAAGPRAPADERERGRLDPAFVERLRRDAADLRGLPSEEKVALYRRHGAAIGEKARIERGALIIASEIRIGAASSIGADSSIECESFRLGRLSAIGRRARVSCRSVEIGDALWCKDDVTMGGGGSNESGARLKIGDAAFIGEAAYLNPCHPITLGDEVCIGARAMLFTHSHWQSILRGYAALFGPIEVGDHVFIGNTAFVFPGVTIGSGATVTVNSFVGVNVPANTLVGGVPARVIRHISMPSRAEQVRLFRERLASLPPLLEARGYGVERKDDGDAVVFDLDDAGRIAFHPRWPPSDTRAARNVLIGFIDEPPSAVPAGTTVFDLQSSRVFGDQDLLSDEVREFCRRLGIRFRPFAWRYRVGHFEGERFVPRP